jgi:hypothetical protein
MTHAPQQRGTERCARVEWGGGELMAHVVCVDAAAVLLHPHLDGVVHDTLDADQDLH